jgi:hypothetical protein
MESVVSRHVGAGVALAVAGVVAVSPYVPPTPPAIHTVNLEARLAASVTNIPTNLVYAVANIPYNEVQAINQLARSLFFTGSWWVASATNIWGTDAGDPGHFESLASLAIPFPAISNTLGHQLAMIAAAELPVNSSCGLANGCSPVTPPAPITGITGLDEIINLAAVVIGLKSLPLIDNWFKVPLSELMSGYTFPTVVSPDGPAYDGFGFEGTHPDPVTGEPVLPWSGTTFTWNPLAPLEDFYDSLTATPPPPAAAVHPVTGEQVIRAVQALLAGLVVDFDPNLPGSPACARECVLPDALTVPAIVKFIGDAYPGNPLIDEWQTATEHATANGPTDEQIADSIRLLQAGVFTFDPATTTQINTLLADIHPVLPSIARDIGLLEDYRLNGDGELQQYGGYFNPTALQADLKQLLGIGPSSTTESTDSSTTTGLSGKGSQTVPDNALAHVLARLSNTRAVQPASVLSIPSLTPKSVRMEGRAARTDPDSPPTGDVLTQVQQDVQSIIRAATEAPAKPVAVPASGGPLPGQTRDFRTKPVEKRKLTTTPSADTTATNPPRDGNMAEPHKVGANGTKAHNGLTGALKSAGDQVSSGISKIAHGLTGVEKTGNAGGRHRAN